jgi:hypothetical protein
MQTRILKERAADLHDAGPLALIPSQRGGNAHLQILASRGKSFDLFPDAEPTKDAIQYVIGVNGADNLAQLVQRHS